MENNPRPTRPEPLKSETRPWQVKEYEKELVTCERELALDSKSVFGWITKGNALRGLKRYKEGLVAYERAAALNRHEFDYVSACTRKGATLCDVERYEEALVAVDLALRFDRDYPIPRAFPIDNLCLPIDKEAKEAIRRREAMSRS